MLAFAVPVNHCIGTASFLLDVVLFSAYDNILVFKWTLNEKMEFLSDEEINELERILSGYR